VALYQVSASLNGDLIGRQLKTRETKTARAALVAPPPFGPSHKPPSDRLSIPTGLQPPVCWHSRSAGSGRCKSAARAATVNRPRTGTAISTNSRPDLHFQPSPRSHLTEPNQLLLTVFRCHCCSYLCLSLFFPSHRRFFCPLQAGFGLYFWTIPPHFYPICRNPSLRLGSGPHAILSLDISRPADRLFACNPPPPPVAAVHAAHAHAHVEDSLNFCLHPTSLHFRGSRFYLRNRNRISVSATVSALVLCCGSSRGLQERCSPITPAIPPLPIGAPCHLGTMSSSRMSTLATSLSPLPSLLSPSGSANPW